MCANIGGIITQELKDINTSYDDLWAHLVYELSFIPWMSLNMQNISDFDWKHGVNWAAIYQADAEFARAMNEHLSTIAYAAEPYVTSPEFVNTWQSYIQAPEIQAALRTGAIAWQNLQAKDQPQLFVLGLYYSAMNTPEVAQVVQTLGQIAGKIAYQIENDTDNGMVTATTLMSSTAVASTPQYGTYALFGLGAIGLGYFAMQKNKKSDLQVAFARV